MYGNTDGILFLRRTIAHSGLIPIVISYQLAYKPSTFTIIKYEVGKEGT